MTDNVRKVFDILGVEPNEHFKVRILGVETDSEPSGYAPLNDVYYIDENLFVHIDSSCKTLPRVLRSLLNADVAIVKLPKGPKKIKKKLRDLTHEEWDKWIDKECFLTYCDNCPFRKVPCSRSINKLSWFNNKDLYSDKFLDQEIEVEE